MIHYILRGHELQNDVQTITQVFYPNLHYICVEEIGLSGMTVVSGMEKGIASAMLYRDGKKVNEFSLHYQEGLIDEKEQKRLIKRTIYEILKEETGLRPQWGILTGIRPAKVMNGLLDEGRSEDDCLRYFIEDYLVMEDKARLALSVAKAEENILSRNKPNDISLYIGIPFCPTRCLYCSFTAYPLAQYQNKVDAYLEALFQELEFVAKCSEDFDMQSIYIGGGTPTSLTEVQLEELLKKIASLFETKNIEYTIEAGRPDTITKEKLRLMKEYGVNRISINPQTMNEETLRRIGREHFVSDICRVFYEARALGHENINMDLILGLPGEDAEDVRNTMEQIMALGPDNITVHTLAIKRASRLKEEFDQHTLATSEVLETMLSIAAEYAQRMDMQPYYMYRQKNMVGNFENVGYCRTGKEGVYNVQIMEEKQTILAVGAGASTKTVDPKTNRIERVFNVKSVDDYIARIDEMIERKRVGLAKGE